MTTAPIRVRFAPSPTGHLHLGNVRTALFNWLFARHTNGTLILRLEDTDAIRSTQASVDSVLEDMRWLGLDWDEGPEVGGAFGPYRQTERYGTYADFVQRLLDIDKAYPCYCTQAELDKGREEAKAAGRTFIYPGTCKRLSASERLARESAGLRPAIRLKLSPHTVAFTDLVRGPVSIHTQHFGDWILTRPDGSPTYNFAVVVDDALMEVTHVIRGEDHLSNTPKQVVLYEALGLRPPTFAHLSMILGTDGSKLSKRHGDVSVDAFRAKGFLPEAMVNGLALLGWSDPSEREVLSRGDLVESFDLTRVNKSAAVFDEAKLRHLNREHLKAMTDSALVAAATPRLREVGYLPDGGLSSDILLWVSDLCSLLKERIEILSDLPSASEPIFRFDLEAMTHEDRSSLREDSSRAVIEAFLEQAGTMDLTVQGVFKTAAGRVKDALGVKGKALFHPLRLALTATASGPDLDRLVFLLERGSRLPLPIPVIGPLDRLRRTLALLG